MLYLAKLIIGIFLSNVFLYCIEHKHNELQAL